MSEPVEREDDSGWTEVIMAISNLRELRDDWNGEGAIAPKPATVSAALRVVEALRQQWHQLPGSVLATPAGTILFAWRRGLSYFEIEVPEVGPPETMSVYGASDPVHSVFCYGEEV